MKRYNRVAPRKKRSHFMMHNAKTPYQEFYNEAEAAEMIGISTARLHVLLDEHVFNDGSTPPETLSFTSADLVLLGFWQRTTPNPKVVRMPKRG